MGEAHAAETDAEPARIARPAEHAVRRERVGKVDHEVEGTPVLQQFSPALDAHEGTLPLIVDPKRSGRKV